MDLDSFQSLSKAIPILKAQESLEQFQVYSLKDRKSPEQRKILNQLSKDAYPKIGEEETILSRDSFLSKLRRAKGIK